MNAVWDFGQWNLSEQWSCVLRLRFNTFSTLAGLFVILAAAAFLVDCRRREGALADRVRLALLLVNVLSLSLLCVAGDILTFYFAWFWVGLSAALLNPHDSASDGVTFSSGRWAPAVLSQTLFLLAIVLVQGMAHSTDWAQISQWAAEATETSGLRASVALISCVLAAWLPFFFLPARREDLWTVYQSWGRNFAAPIGAVVLLGRVGFLASMRDSSAEVLVGVLAASATVAAVNTIWRPAHRLSLSAFGVSVGAVICGLCLTWDLVTPWPLRLAVLSTILVGAASIRLRSAAWKWSAPEDPATITNSGFVDATTRSWRRIDQSFWDGIWQVPVRLAYAVGGGFVYWQGNSAQYTLVVILIGTLLFFWAALKTQVIW